MNRLPAVLPRKPASCVFRGPSVAGCVGLHRGLPVSGLCHIFGVLRCHRHRLGLGTAIPDVLMRAMQMFADKVHFYSEVRRYQELFDCCIVVLGVFPVPILKAPEVCADLQHIGRDVINLAQQRAALSLEYFNLARWRSEGAYRRFTICDRGSY